MDIKELIGKTLTITDIDIDSEGDITVTGKTPTELIKYSDTYSYPAHNNIVIHFISHGDYYNRCGDLVERSHIESYFEEYEIDEDEEKNK
jgi:hypothetical protein